MDTRVKAAGTCATMTARCEREGRRHALALACASTHMRALDVVGAVGPCGSAINVSLITLVLNPP